LGSFYIKYASMEKIPQQKSYLAGKKMVIFSKNSKTQN